MLSRKAGLFGESVIRGMTQLCTQHGGINLAQGFPDWDPPQEVKEAAIRAIQAGINQYSITWGAPRLREAIAAKARSFNRIEVDPQTMITVTCGATEAMMASMLAVIDPGDEVVIFEPFYENYGPDAIISGATPRYVPLYYPEFRFDRDELRAAFGPRTKAIVVNTPHNPSGKVFARDELQCIAELCQEFDALAITDEIYQHIIYIDRPHVSLATLPGMAERTITICGMSKSYSVTGWRIAYTLASPALTAGIRKMHDFLTVGAPAPLQEAGAVALALPDGYYKDLVALYDGKRRLLLRLLGDVGFECYTPEGAYYIMTDFSAFGFRDDTEFAHYLVREVGVAAVPGTSFYFHRELGRTKIRFNFAKRDEVLREAAARLEKLNRRR
jgi:aminotransferase